MQKIANQIEAILFIAGKSVSYKKLSELVGTSVEDVKKALEILKDKYLSGTSGVMLMEHGGSVQFVTSPDVKDVVEEFIKDELTGEMTKPQLETLTIIAYRGPILKEELELIRGVNCSLILRNLMMRGLVEVVKDKEGDKYQVTMDFLRFLGVSSVEELPDYEELSKHQNVEELISNKDKEETD